MKSKLSSLITASAAATFFLAPAAEQLVRMTPARLYFVKTLPERTDYLILIALILLIGATAGWFADRGYNLPVYILCGVGIEHLIQGHLSRYAPVWNWMGREFKEFDMVVADGWVYVGAFLAAILMLLIARFTVLWNGFRPVLCGGAMVVWGSIGMKLASPPRFFPEMASHKPRAPISQAVYSHPRPPVVWIVFDEWDFDLTFAREDAAVFPEIDRLSRQSVFFEHAKAAGKVTLVAIPSLLTGIPVLDFRALNASTGKLKNEAFPGNVETIFDVAAREGYRSSIVGWYHPYCRLFGEQLESCYWDQSAMPVLVPHSDPFRKAVAMLRESVDLEYLPGIGVSNTIQRHIGRYEPMLKESERVAVRKGAAFSFLHLPVPHPPFFDHQHHQIPASPQTYVNGLQRADEALGRIRQHMEQAGVWDEALVVVTSDHPYRYQYLGGYGNGHIPLMIKFPHQTSGAVHTLEFEARNTRAILEAAMRGQVTSTEAGLAFLQTSFAEVGHIALR